MDSIFVLGFTAAVIGGLDSPVGAVVGGLILGVVLSYVGGYLGSDLVDLVGLPRWWLVLMLRPAGLFSAARDQAGVTMTLARAPGRRAAGRRASSCSSLSYAARLVPRLPAGRGGRLRRRGRPG